MNKYKQDIKYKHYGQVFTRKDIISRMVGLMQNNNSKILEPACGEGAFIKELMNNDISINNITSIEIDRDLYNLNHNYLDNYNTINTDFFNYSINNKFGTIIGNPPYVKYNNIIKSTKELIKFHNYDKIFDARSNLYLFFINKCIDHLHSGGELILIIPRDMLKATSAKILNQRLYAEGSFTYIEDLGDDQVFDNFNPNCIIFRWVKGRKNKILKLNAKNKVFNIKSGQIYFTDCNIKKDKKYKLISDYFEVKVGAVSGADDIFTNEEYGIPFVCSYTNKTGKTKKMIYNQEYPHTELFKYKDILINRKIKRFNEDNWFCWGRGLVRDTNDVNRKRIYVNCKTRNKKPFFINKVINYDGSILGLFLKPGVNLKIDNKLVDKLNNINWNELGFMCNNRYIFSQRSLQNAVIEELNID